MSNSNGASDPLPGADDLAREGKRIPELIEKIQRMDDPAARAMLQDCLENVLGFYGRGLERIMSIVQQAARGEQNAHDALVQDPGVSGLLLIHGLHPVPLDARLNQALEKVRPYMKSHGGDVELISLVDDHAVLRLNGHCKTCPSSTVTMELAVRSALEEGVPDLNGFELENAVAESAEDEAAFTHTPNAAPEWTRLDRVGALPEGGLASVPAENETLLVCRIDGQLYAYQDRCPGCNMPLHLGHLSGATLTCGMGHSFDAKHAGCGLGDVKLHLEPIPLLEQNGEIKVALRPHRNSAAPLIPEAARP